MKTRTSAFEVNPLFLAKSDFKNSFNLSTNPVGRDTEYQSFFPTSSVKFLDL